MPYVYTAKDPLSSLTAHIVSAYVGRHILPAGDLPNLITRVHQALDGLGDQTGEPAEPEKPVPAVSIRKSVQDEYLICLEDGQKFKSLKRHLMTHYGMTADDYRSKWGLPSNYPMVAPSYAAKRSELAKANGLGQPRKSPHVAREEGEAMSEKIQSTPKKARRQSAGTKRNPRPKSKQTSEAAE
ncbi:MucR family transcriptional regulator [Rhizobium sp. YIM 134829]|uniref:MucR family transcriptional regulator n=1 Tax=Rhizobium sp. YIM 134829 TaxID=3390453 RepID=UPI00397811AF